MAENSTWIIIVVIIIILLLFYLDTHSCQCQSRPENFAMNSATDGYYIMDPDISEKQANAALGTFMNESTTTSMVVPDRLRADIDNNYMYTIPMDSRASPDYPGLDDFASVIDANDSRVPYDGVDPSIVNEWTFNGLYSPLNDRDYYQTIPAFNDYEKKLSYMQANNPYLLANMYRNPYVDLSVQEARLQPQCINYNDVTECITKCSDEEECVGFFIRKDAMGNDIKKCCFLKEPIPPAVQGERQTYYFDSYDPAGNPTYVTQMNLKNCLDQCPECNLNNCPVGYKCSNIKYDMRNSNCKITNNTRLKDVALEGNGLVINNEGFNNLDLNIPGVRDIYNAGPSGERADILINAADAGSANQFMNELVPRVQSMGTQSMGTQSMGTQSMGTQSMGTSMPSVGSPAARNRLNRLKKISNSVEGFNGQTNIPERLGSVNSVVPPTMSNDPNASHVCLDSINQTSQQTPKCLAGLSNWRNLMEVNQAGINVNNNLVINASGPTNPDLAGTANIFQKYVAYNNAGLWAQ
jgi:molybdopterin/thiamine biosynthesis adenylyltransferase